MRLSAIAVLIAIGCCPVLRAATPLVVPIIMAKRPAPAATPAQLAIQKFVQAGGGSVNPNQFMLLADPDLAALFPDATFSIFNTPHIPGATVPVAPLKYNNIFAVDAKGAVTHMFSTGQLQQFFKEHLPAVKTKQDAQTAAAAFLALASQLAQDGGYSFIPAEPQIVDGKLLIVKITAAVEPNAGDKGSLTVTLTFDAEGKLSEAKQQSTLEPGVPPE